MSILIQVTIFDEYTGAVERQIAQTHSGTHWFEILQTFEKLGEKVAKIACPGWDPEA